MGCLLVLFGFGVAFWGFATFMVLVVGGGVDYTIGAIIPLAITLLLFVLCLKKYRSPEYQEKLRKSRESWEAGAPERERLRKETEARKRDEERKRNTIVSTRLIGEGSAEYKKSVAGMAFRGAVGGMFGGVAGAALGMATTKNKNTNKNVRRFLVKYLDGHIEEQEAKIGSLRYNEYMKYLEWE